MENNNRQSEPANAVSGQEAAMTVGQALQQALSDHHAGRLAEAERFYRAILQAKPGHPSANHNLGVLLLQAANPAAAIVYFKAAMAVAQDNAEIHYNLANAFRQLGQSADALAHYRRATELKPDFAEALYYAGVSQQQLGQMAEAEASYRRTLAIQPDFAPAYTNLGTLFYHAGKLEQAESSLRQALAIQPGMLDARKNLGNVLHAIADKKDRAAFLQASGNFQGVRLQYETLPFPSRNPEAEHYILKLSLPDVLSKINQYCFGGSRDFSQPFRVLVAGCGTGDSVVWLAHQLKGTQAEVVAIDISGASLQVAQARAKVHGLDTIRWVHASLLDVARLGLGEFDYITCLGVLHHLPDPEQGLAALESVLADGGAMALMLYGAVGRSHIYAMQQLLRGMTAGLDDPRARLEFAKKIVANLPARNEFLLREGAETIQSRYLQNDTNFWDTLLHEQDRAYTAAQVRGFLESAGLHLQAYISYQGQAAITRLQYDLDEYLDDASDRARLQALPLAERENLAEALDGSLALHTVYAARAGATALDVAAPHAILEAMSNSAQNILLHLIASSQPLPITLRNGRAIHYAPAPITKVFLSAIDGVRDNRDILSALGVAENSADMQTIRRDLHIPAALHWLVARTRSGSRLPRLADIDSFSIPLSHFEPISLPVAPA